jgi:NAD-dependent SIR2 family protein deacetylase
MTYQTFTGSEQARRRYWARSHLGWRFITDARPNDGHRAVAALERAGLVTGVITQNVDGLHHAAGSVAVTELHGSLHQVRCLDCGERTSRVALHERLAAANPRWNGSSTLINPDGDAVVADAEIESFTIADCASCGGVLKPDVVFFGENVPPATVIGCYDQVASARSLIVLGSSLTVMSGLRYVKHAAKHGLPIVIINQGETRGDEYATIRLDAPLGETLTGLARGSRQYRTDLTGGTASSASRSRPAGRLLRARVRSSTSARPCRQPAVQATAMRTPASRPPRAAMMIMAGFRPFP